MIITIHKGVTRIRIAALDATEPLFFNSHRRKQPRVDCVALEHAKYRRLSGMVVVANEVICWRFGEGNEKLIQVAVCGELPHCATFPRCHQPVDAVNEALRRIVVVTHVIRIRMS